ncbi:arginyltransferase [Pseudogulbenkiania subflava]|uniref:Aspartate/glutamate leucyltransferase n=1 Tax=Pseudogulbenkiania subflava DSM 22618 TaxID=1123014 RepID=A0A1Y6BJL0_9NEIS|nr:arginyltransferase [Pseudogulbenkiania subflava]SMF07164.1 arginine-tRNA-protein transferase [Pseudogulbenkiania subflava DSM 22618]
MSHRDAGPLMAIHFYATAPYPCSYIPDLQARSQVAIPAEAIDSAVYSQLVRLGFRRSGHYTYRPYCDGCKACQPVRIPVAAFTSNRTQRRAWKKHDSLAVELLPLLYREEHYDLYRRYQAARHAGGGMSEDDSGQYAEFILKSNVESFLAEFRQDGVLKMVSLIDRLSDGLSAVYTFYEPDDVRASYGVYNVLWQVRLASRLGLPYVYLGYWIEGCRKMDYKSAYRPLERLRDGRWEPFC